MMRLLRSLLLLCLLVLLGIYYALQQPLPVLDTNKPLVLEHGASLYSISNQLVNVGILSEPWSFILLVRASGRYVRSGNYQLVREMTYWDLFNLLTQNSPQKNIAITLVEGWSFRQIREALNSHPTLQHRTPQMSNADILTALHISGTHPEGLFFPDTYFINSRSSDLDVLKNAYQAMQTKIAQNWEGRADGLPYTTPYEALIMASIVEKETGKNSERPLIASVFLNRLRIGMRLQTDPTVIYGIGEQFNGNLSKANLKADTPYNTYTRPGLPPTPICMPGLASIHAALHPINSDFLYFVGKGDGSHAFSNNLKDHNHMVRKYQLQSKAAS